MTDNEIIKVIEGMLYNYSSSDCQLVKVLGMALDLINRQKAEVDNLKHSLKCVKDHKEGLIERNKFQRAEIERLQAEIDEVNEADRETELQALTENKENAKLFCDAINHAKSEAIKEFAERLKDDICNICPDRVFEYDEVQSTIDNLVKEMAGDGNG